MGLGIAWSRAAAADPPVTPPVPTVDVETVEVQGTRVPAPSKTGASVTTLSRPMLESLPGGDTQPLAYAIASQPGMVADTFGFGVHARGADGGILYVIDGIPLLTVPLGTYGVGSFLPVRMVRSLQLTTGGFPAEYGVGLGAVVDVTTRHAVGGAHGDVQVAYGTNDLFLPSFDYSQEIGRLSLFVAGNYESTSRGLDPPSVSPVLHDGLTAGSGFARLDYEIDRSDRAELIASFTQSQYQIPIDPTVLPLSDAPPGAVRGNDAYGNPPPPFVPYDGNPTDAERDVFVALSYTHRWGGDARLQVAPYIHEASGQLLCDPAGSLGATADPGSTCSDVRRDIVHEGALVNVAWKPDAVQSWKTGATFDFAESQVSYASYTRDDASPSGGADPALTLSGQDVADVMLVGVYVQDQLSLGRWTLFPGARLDAQHASFLGSEEPALDAWGPSARLGVSYALTDDVVLHAFAGYLWQPPNAIDGAVAARVLVPSLAGQPLPVDIKPERDWSGEIGIAERIARRVTLGLTGWGRYAYDQLDRQNVGNTNLVASYNFAQGRAAGAEVWANLALGRVLDGFVNGGWQLAQGQGVDSEKYLFTPAELAFTGWGTLDHVQTWTSNVGFDLHDDDGSTHLSGLMSYGSGLRTGATDQLSVPEHTTLDVTLRHRFDLPLRPEVAVDVFNVFDDVYAIRIATGYVGSAYGPLRHANVRLKASF
jgi:hypothetical protein